MGFIKDVTKMKNSSYGLGIFKKIEGNIITVEFEIGKIKQEKKFQYPKCMGNALSVIEESNQIKQKKIQPLNSNDGTMQLDSSINKIGECNVIEAFNNNRRVIFNESYIVIGQTLKVAQIYANYDLHVIGNLEVDEITVNGNLIVTGKIEATKLSCENDIFCNGNLISDEIFIGGNATLQNVKCNKINCIGNLVVKETIDIDEIAEGEKAFVAFEGITGKGDFKVKKAVAIEYFEFKGNIEGNVYEIETGDVISHTVDIPCQDIHSISEMLEVAVDSQIKTIDLLDENEILLLLTKLSLKSYTKTPNYKTLTEKMIEYSYLHKIDNFRDLLLIIYADSILPIEIKKYETISGVFDQLLTKAMIDVIDLKYKINNIEELAMSIHIINECMDTLPIKYDEAADKIFSSIGIRYSTVRKLIER